MKKISLCIGALIALFLICRPLWIAFHKSQGFSVSKMSASLPFEKQWEVPPPSQEQLEEIFNQKFHFLSAGYQAYAFMSEDEKTIIKFFRMKRLTHSWLDPLFHPDKVKTHKKNLYLLFDAYKLAYDKMGEDAGLVYIHLNQTDFIHKKLSITDQSGKEHLIDLDKVHFALQEKAEPLFIYLLKFVEQKDKEGLQKAMDALLTLIQRRQTQGIGDEDRGIAENYGFIGERPIQFDIGRIYKGKFEGEYEEILRRLHWWVQLNPIP